MENIITEFISALDEEITTLKQGRGGSITKVFNGKLIRKVPNGFVYIFHLENFLATLDDAPAEIEINHQIHKANVLLTRGLEVEICIEDYCGEFVAEAKLHNNLWYLLEMLKKKFSESASDTAKFKLSNALFSGDTSQFPPNTYAGDTRYSPTPASPPNPAQQRAIEASFKKPLTIIWGPPGTGKTTTIAKAIEAHLNAGRKVLLVSHANNAVDQALMDVAQQMKATSYYQNGELVRLGTPTDPAIYKEMEDKYEMVLMDRIGRTLGASLVSERDQLQKKKADVDQRVEELKTATNLITQVDSLLGKLESSVQAVQGYGTELIQIEQSLRQLEQLRTADQARLQEAMSSGALKRFFKSLNPQKIQTEINKTTIAIDSQQRQIAALKERLEASKKEQSETLGEVRKVTAERDQALKRFSISSPELFTKISLDLGAEIKTIQKRISEIDGLLDELQKGVLGKAKLVATTLTKTFCDKNLENLGGFDVLFVDEASMAPLPYVYWAASKCTQFITIVGDFLQLPPIAISDGAMSKKWLARSIFGVLDINTVEKADKSPLVNLLDTQYRMVPEIAEIPRTFFYQEKLKTGESAKAKNKSDGITEKPLVLVKTERMNPWCSRLSTGGRFNLYNALVCATLARRILERGYTGNIGIATPYVAQARLINHIAKDWGLENVHISTIHRFQGGEEPIIIFDTVEATGTYIAPMLSGGGVGSETDLLLNVAITRAESKFYLVAHTGHLQGGLSYNSTLAKLLKYMEKNGEKRDSDEFVDSYLVTDFEKYTQAPPVPPFMQNDGNFYTEKNFWMHFDQDLNTVQERLIILSPFLSIRRSDRFMNRFQALLAKGVKIFVYTRPKGQQTGEMVHQAEVVIEHLLAIGAKVIERKDMHQKVAIMDDRIAWEGSLNILSHRDTGEQMRRLEGQATISDIVKNLELDGDDAVGNYSTKVCPVCSRPLIYKTGKFGKFLGCSGFSAHPQCTYTENIGKPYRKKSAHSSRKTYSKTY